MVSSGRSGFLEANLIRIRISIWDGVIALGSIGFIDMGDIGLHGLYKLYTGSVR